jgi:DNA polymerase-3 subunit alpha
VEAFVQWDAIVMVDGKVDTYGAEPKILVDKITTELKHVMPLETPPPLPQNSAPHNEVQVQTSQMVAPNKENPPAPKKVTEQSTAYAPLDVDDEVIWNDDDDLPPPPDAFPPDWEEMFGPADSVLAPVEAYSALIEAATPESGEMLDEHLPAAESEVAVPEPKADDHPVETESTTMSAEVTPQETAREETDAAEPIVKAEIPEKIIHPIVPPMPASDGQDINMITVILRPRTDKVRDNLLLRRVFGLMISYPGKDRFAFHIFEKGRGHLLEFPNLTTGMNLELMERLTTLVGPENIRVEPITFQ